MSVSSTSNKIYNIIGNLLTKYESVMLLKIFVDSSDNELKEKYLNVAQVNNDNLLTNNFIDAGFDLFVPETEQPETNVLHFNTQQKVMIGNVTPTRQKKIDFNVCCSSKMYSAGGGKSFNSGYYLYPRSSISKTPLRLSNSIGIIDSGYRGHLIGMFDVVHIQNDNITNNNNAPYYASKFDRYLQICAPNLAPIVVEVVNSIGDLGVKTLRGSGGFGSTGQ